MLFTRRGLITLTKAVALVSGYLAIEPKAAAAGGDDQVLQEAEATITQIGAPFGTNNSSHFYRMDDGPNRCYFIQTALEISPPSCVSNK